MEQFPFENPFENPPSLPPVVGVKGGTREDLRKVAVYQRGIVFSILVYLASALAGMVLPEALAIVLGIIGIGAMIAGAVFTIILGLKVYSTGVGILLGILSLVPLVGLIVLLVVSNKATGILRQNGIRVGLLGANPSGI